MTKDELTAIRDERYKVVCACLAARQALDVAHDALNALEVRLNSMYQATLQQEINRAQRGDQ